MLALKGIIRPPQVVSQGRIYVECRRREIKFGQIGRANDLGSQ